MKGLTWLHISDWHQEGKEFNRKVVRDKLLDDLRERGNRIDPLLDQVDFIVFSGDVTHKGKKEEFQAAKEQLFAPVLNVLQLQPDRLFIVPGNHDLDREAFKFVPKDGMEPFTTEEKIQEWLNNEEERNLILRPFKEYNEFVKPYAGGSLSAYSCIKKFDLEGNTAALLGLNSAWLCGRNKDHKGEVEDARKLAIGEHQWHDALEQIKESNLRIAVLHHPFEWLMDIDRNRCEERLRKECHFILRGHQHIPQVNIIKGTFGDCVIIPAGSCYERRTPSDPRYTNSYNFVCRSFQQRKNTVPLPESKSRWTD